MTGLKRPQLKKSSTLQRKEILRIKIPFFKILDYIKKVLKLISIQFFYMTLKSYFVTPKMTFLYIKLSENLTIAYIFKIYCLNLGTHEYVVSTTVQSIHCSSLISTLFPSRRILITVLPIKQHTKSANISLLIFYVVV